MFMRFLVCLFLYFFFFIIALYYLLYQDFVYKAPNIFLVRTKINI